MVVYVPQLASAPVRLTVAFSGVSFLRSLVAAKARLIMRVIRVQSIRYITLMYGIGYAVAGLASGVPSLVGFAVALVGLTLSILLVNRRFYAALPADEASTISSILMFANNIAGAAALLKCWVVFFE